jgi:acyl-CoA thioester hydrolase
VTGRGVPSRAADNRERVSELFVGDMTVPEGDIDALGHASNVAYIRWVQDVARAHSEQVGWSHDTYRDAGMIFVVRRHEIDYLRPALAGDALTLRTWIASWSAATSLRRTVIERDGVAIAKAHTTWALVSLETGRPCRITPDLKEAFGRADAD